MNVCSDTRGGTCYNRHALKRLLNDVIIHAACVRHLENAMLTINAILRKNIAQRDKITQLLKLVCVNKMLLSTRHQIERNSAKQNTYTVIKLSLLHSYNIRY